MLQVNIFDNNFGHSINEDGFDTASMGRKPQVMQWVRSRLDFDGPTVFTDEMMFDPIVDKVKCKYKIGWAQESPIIKPDVIANLDRIKHKFDFILTHSQEHISRDPKKYKRQIIASSRVRDEDMQIYKKTKNISIIASSKTWTEGHLLRHKIIKNLQGVDIWGGDYKAFDNKLDPLKDYMFSIAIMNARVENYFTEILNDCFVVGTIPIFWGCPNIGDFYAIDGILPFETIDDLHNIKISKKTYESKLSSIKKNFELGKSYASTDDLVAKNIISLINNI